MALRDMAREALRGFFGLGSGAPVAGAPVAGGGPALRTAAADTVVQNPTTGLGVRGRDRNEDLQVAQVPVLTWETTERLWRMSTLVQRLVGQRTTEAVSKGVDLSVEEGSTVWLQEELVRLAALQRGEEGRRWGRLYGGALVCAVVEGAGESHEPLDLARVRRVVALRVFDRQSVFQVTWENGAEDPARTGLPRTYLIQPPGTAPPVLYHHSRVWRFDGVPTPSRVRAQQWGWDDSALVGVYPALLRLWAAAAALATQMQDSNVGVWKLRDFSNWIAGGNQAAVDDWLQTQILYRGILGDHVIGEGDSFEFRGRPLKDSVEIFYALLLSFAAEVDIPYSILYGVSPSGLNASEKSDLEKWNRSVTAGEQPLLGAYVGWLVALLQAQTTTPRHLRDVPVRVSWPALGEESQREEAEQQKTRAEADKILVEMGALRPEEVRERLRLSPHYLIDDGDAGGGAGADGADGADTFKPTAAMAGAAKLGLELRGKFGRGGTRVGQARARQFAAREGVSAQVVMRTYRFFERFKGERGRESTTGRWGDESRPSNAYIAWLLWGGDPGWRWARAIVEREGWVEEDAGADGVGQGADAGSVWVGFRLPEALASRRPPLAFDATPAHITLLTFDPGALPVEGLVEEVLRPLALGEGAVGRATLGRLGHIVGPSGKVAVYQAVDFEREGRLEGLRDALVEALQGRGSNVPFDGWWRAHLTLAYLERPTDVYAGPVLSGSWWAGELVVWVREGAGVRELATLKMSP